MLWGFKKKKKKIIPFDIALDVLRAAVSRFTQVADMISVQI